MDTGNKYHTCGVDQKHYITDIPRFVATLTIYGVISHILRNPYLKGKQVSNTKHLNPVNGYI